MIDLGLEFRTNLKNLYINKQFSLIEDEIESLKNLEDFSNLLKSLL